MTAVEREREYMRRQFEDAYYRCRRDPMEGLSFTEEDMRAAIERSLNIFRASDELAAQEGTAQVADVAAPGEVKERVESDDEEEGVVEEEVGVFKVGDTVSSSLSFQKKITLVSVQCALSAFVQLGMHAVRRCVAGHFFLIRFRIIEKLHL